MKLLVTEVPTVDAEAFKSPLVQVFVNAFDRDQIHPSRGAVVVIASTQGGKSQKVAELNEVLSARDDVLLGHIAFGEPTVDKYMNQLSAPTLLTEEQLVSVVDDLLDQGATHIIIDSIRLLQYTQDGAATSGGMSTGTFTLLTHLSTVCYERGVTLILPLNPNVKDDLYPIIRKNIEGSVHTVIDLEENKMVARELDRASIKYTGASDFMNAFYTEEQLQKTTHSFELRRKFSATIGELETVSSRLVETIAPEDAVKPIQHEVAPGKSIKSIKGRI